MFKGGEKDLDRTYCSPKKYTKLRGQFLVNKNCLIGSYEHMEILIDPSYNLLPFKRVLMLLLLIGGAMKVL